MSAFFKNWKCVRGGGAIFPSHQLKKRGNRERRGGGNIPPSSTQKTRDWREEGGLAIFPPHQLKKRGIGDRKGGGIECVSILLKLQFERLVSLYFP